MVAQDFGEPALRHTTNVFISVDDVNDEIPKFEQDEQRYDIFLERENTIRTLRNKQLDWLFFF